MSRFFCRWLLGVIALCLGIAAAQARENRVALVVGNGAYTSAEPLRNPVNDARDMARLLEAAGFEVILRENATRRMLTEALGEFAGKITPGGVGLFFFAGHGFQVRGVNYLVPVDAALSTEYDAKYETLDVGDVLSRLDEARARLSLVILDACRDNPFARRFRSASARGLAQVDAPRGTVIAYATAPGETAADGDGANGVYTGELLKAIATPGLKLEDVFKRTIDGVARVSGNRQTPWVSSSFRGEFFFLPPAPAPAPPAPAPAPTSPEVLELAAWNAVSASANPDVLEAFLQRFPDGIYAGIARARLAELRSRQAAAMQPPPTPPRTDDGEARRKAAAEEDEARRKAEATAAADAAMRAAAEEARRKAEADAAMRAAADEARRRTEAEAEAKRLAADEAKRQAADEAKRKADAEAADRQAAERAEQALQLTAAQRRRIQGGLTIKGFNTGGADGAFGPRTRQMIADFQRSLKEEPTGFLTAAQFEALLRDTEQAWTRMEQERQKTEDQRRAAAPAGRGAPQGGPVAPGARDGGWRITGSCPEATFSSFTISGSRVSAYVALNGHDGQIRTSSAIVVPVSSTLQPDGGFSFSYGGTLAVSGQVSATAISGTVHLREISKRCPLTGRR